MFLKLFHIASSWPSFCIIHHSIVPHVEYHRIFMYHMWGCSNSQRLPHSEPRIKCSKVCKINKGTSCVAGCGKWRSPNIKHGMTMVCSNTSNPNYRRLSCRLLWTFARVLGSGYWNCDTFNPLNKKMGHVLGQRAYARQGCTFIWYVWIWTSMPSCMHVPRYNLKKEVNKQIWKFETRSRWLQPRRKP